MSPKPTSTFDAFNQDVASNTGYLYTTNASLSSVLANRRLTNAALAATNFHDKRVVDIGCGDGSYTVELFDRGRPASMHGVDPAVSAIDLARQKAQHRNIIFEAESAYELSCPDNSFDIAHLRGVLHHLDRPIDALREAFRVAPTLVVIEPNGYNLGLKLLERFSRYHREHQEKSYAPRRLNRWVEDLGGTITRHEWVGLVPFFCPDWFARSMKAIEPFVEGIPIMNTLACAVYMITATRRDA